MKTKTSEVKSHSPFGGSQAERIMQCPGSVKLSEGEPNPENEASIRGTHAHACLEFIVNNRKLLKKRNSRVDVLEKAESNKDWDSDMINHALDALAWIEENIGVNGEVFVETHLDSSKFTTKGQHSTLDISIVNWNSKEIIVCDYKYGKHPVKVKNNSQIIYYALAMLIKLKAWKKIDKIRCVIIQPNAYAKPQEWFIWVEDAIKWGRKFKRAVNMALAPNPPLKYGDKWCFFCLAKKKCPEYKDAIAQKYINKDLDVIEN